jgi:Caspase domain
MKHAIIIGINYQNTDSELPDCELDADRIHNHLKGTYDVIEKHYAITPQYFLNRIQELSVTLTKTDTLAVFYSGHGTQYQRQGKIEEALVFYQNGFFQLLKDTYLVNSLKTCRCNVILYLDSCFAGGMNTLIATNHKAKNMTLENPLVHAEAFAIPVVQKSVAAKILCLFASQKQEPSMSTGDGGMFTNAVLRSLKEVKKEANVVISEAVVYCQGTQKPKIVGVNKKQLIF